MSHNLLILGASARAAAWSAVRAGYSVVAADLFADRDLQDLCVAHPIDGYPDELESIAASAPPGPWMYTGGLENHPELVGRIARSRTLWGNVGEPLRDIRNPEKVYRALRDAGLSCPEIRWDGENVPRNGSWLRKPLRSSGGFGVERLGPNRRPPTGRDDVYFQQYVEGQSNSAVFVARAGGAELLGVTRQLTGTPWTGARGFGYAGSLGPLPLDEQRRDHWRRIGQCLSRRFALCGLFGVDAIQSEEDLWPVEVNPRYTASVEVVERATGARAIALHARASADDGLGERLPTCSGGFCGKAILYAREHVYVSGRFKATVAAINQAAEDCTVADIPAEGQRIPCGRPVTTVLVNADDTEQAVEKLKKRTAQLRLLLDRASDLRC